MVTPEPRHRDRRPNPDAWFGEFLIAQRRALRWSQDELAGRSTVSTRTIRNLETGTILSPRKVSVELLLNAFAAAGVRPVADPAAGSPPDRPEPPELVGRSDEVRRVCDALSRDRYLTLTGPGGVGKTALALAVGDRRRSVYREPVAVVRLGEQVAGGRAMVDRHIATALEQHQLANPQADGLLILDNVEHLLPAVTAAGQRLLERRPRLRLLATSRQVPATPAVRGWEVGPLSEERAVELFVQRADQACPNLDLTGRLAAVARVCDALDRMPFAVERAALRLRSISLETLLRNGPVAQIVDQVDDTSLPHQRTLADSVRWSYDALGPEHRWLLCRLAAFDGPVAFGDVEHECLRRGRSSRDTADLLGALTDASLVQVRHAPDYAYHMIGYVRALVRRFEAPAPQQPRPCSELPRPVRAAAHQRTAGTAA